MKKMNNFNKIACLTIAVATSLLLRADYKFSAITNAATGATVTTILIPDGSPVATSNIMQKAVDNAIAEAKKYTDDAISEGGGSGTSLKIATGKFLAHIDYSPLHDGWTNDAPLVSGCYLTNIVLNPNTGVPISVTVHLNGTFCGREFNNEEFVLDKQRYSSEVYYTINDEDSQYELYYQTYSPMDTVKDTYKSVLTVGRLSPQPVAEMLGSFTENRAFANIESEVDAKPFDHDKRLVTSKGVYISVSNKLAKSGGTMSGNIVFDSNETTISASGWTKPKYNISGVDGFNTGNIISNGTAYAAGVGVGVSAYTNEFPAAFWIKKIINDPLRQTWWMFDEYGMSQEYLVTEDGTTTEEVHRLLFPTNETGMLKEGTLARMEDIASIMQEVSEAKQSASEASTAVSTLQTTGLKSPTSLILKYDSDQTGFVQTGAYDGSAQLTLQFTDDFSVQASERVQTYSINSTKFATKSNVASVKQDIDKDLSVFAETAIDRVFVRTPFPPDTVTAVYCISSTLDNTEYKVALCTTNRVKQFQETTYLQIANPVPAGQENRGWMKAVMSEYGYSTTNWTLYVYIDAEDPRWGAANSITINGKPTPIFPMEIGETIATSNNLFFVRKIDQFRGSASRYLSGDGAFYTITGDKADTVVTADTNGIVKVSDWDSLVITNATGETQTLASFVDYQMVSPVKTISEENIATFALVNRAYNYATQSGEFSVNLEFPSYTGQARVFYFVYNCVSTGVPVTLPSSGYTFYVLQGSTDYLEPTLGLNIYKFEEVQSNKVAITVSHYVEKN